MKKANYGETIEEIIDRAEKIAPEWKTSHYALPALMNLIPLFPVARGEKARHIELTFPETAFGSLHYSGPVLSQAHKRVLAELVSQRNGKLLNGYFNVKPFEMCEVMGWGVNARNKANLRQIISDLMDPKLTTWKRGGAKERGHYFRLVADFDSEDDACWRVQLSGTAMAMLTEMNLTTLSRRERTQLRDGLQTFLYDYYRSMPLGHSATFEELLKASGSKASNINEFARQAKEAAGVIKESCKWGVNAKLRGQLQMFKTTGTVPLQ